GTSTTGAGGTSCPATNAISGRPGADVQPGASVAEAGSAIADRTCTECAAGTYSAGTNAITCTAWTECEPGSVVSSAGNAITDRTDPEGAEDDDSPATDGSQGNRAADRHPRSSGDGS